MALATFLQTFIPAVDDEIRSVVDGAGDCEVYDLARYQLGWTDERGEPVSTEDAARFGGKKLRPALVLLACEACGGDWQFAVPAAAAIELIHNFSLIHDDVEDGDRLRRHRLTVWGAWGVPKAVNAGSAVQALVYRAALGVITRGADPAVALGLVDLLTAAILEMTEGQHMDIDFQDRGSVTVADYFDMTSRKTGALLEAALRIGARMAGAPRAVEDGLARFGRSFGLAFQARDDYLGVWGDPAQSGKAVGADIERKKKSLPIVYALQHDPEGAGARVSAVMAKEVISAAECESLAEELSRCGAREFTERAADDHRQDAVSTLSGVLDDTEPARALKELAELAVLRRH